jgi:hypothetical protein
MGVLIGLGKVLQMLGPSRESSLKRWRSLILCPTRYDSNSDFELHHWQCITVVGKLRKERISDHWRSSFSCNGEFRVWITKFAKLQGPCLGSHKQRNSLTLVDRRHMHQSRRCPGAQSTGPVGVHIWLGKQADDSEIAFQVAHQLAKQKPQGPGHPDVVYPEASAEQRSIHRKALAKLCARPWWERVWVRQELAVANDVSWISRVLLLSY